MKDLSRRPSEFGALQISAQDVSGAWAAEHGKFANKFAGLQIQDPAVEAAPENHIG